MQNENQVSFTGWARVEVMGHQTHIGHVKTEVYGSAVMFRVDTPQLPEREYVLEEPAYVEGCWTTAGATVRRQSVEGSTVMIGAGSIYRMIPCTEAAAMKAIETLGRAELKLVDLPPAKMLEVAWPESEPRTGVEENEEPESHGHDCLCPSCAEETTGAILEGGTPEPVTNTFINLTPECKHPKTEMCEHCCPF